MEKEGVKNKRNIWFISILFLFLILFAGYLVTINKISGTTYVPPCMNVRFRIDPANTCYNNLTKEIMVAISRHDPDFTPTGIQLFFSDTKKIVTIRVSGNNQVRMNNSNYGMPLEIPGMGQEKEYIINLSDVGYPDNIRVAGIIKQGKTDKICDTQDVLYQENIGNC